MARRKRHMGESATEDNDEESVSSPSILGSMLSLDEELNGGRKSTKSPRKSHIPIYDPESSPTKSPRPPKRKAYPPKEEPIEPSVLHQDSVFVSTPDEIPTKPAPVRLDFPNHVTGSPPRHLTSVAKGSSRKAPHTALPPLPAYPMAAVQDAYPWSKFMLQQMMQSSHHVHGAATPVVYVPILNPAYMAEVKHQSGYDNKQHVQPLVPSPPSSYVKECTELVMSHRGIDVIGNFDAFVSVEVLWLNHNNIEKIAGLDNCFRIKYLYLQHNHIRSLEGSLRHFTFLRELRLYHNNLHDLHSALKLLEKLVHLEDLDLFGNPLAEEDKYRLHVIASIPSLQVFDRHVVTPEEQLSAKK
ncbi:hypothetical protein DYB25_009129 [Aphanomyces astaci]|uniref:U2A'/phosphoprotein 32 family A C-terminal domain-containing protein n=1 Tax=Aphanomyces astaci TaxID=112090 RepID=A0A397E9B0_APHAT|nr:hypothetical protein DYB25_009129 [Aphanomyces astaci]RHY78662.1 hypothetical protein DYB31_007166 [Aphanomyces astaci]